MTKQATVEPSLLSEDTAISLEGIQQKITRLEGYIAKTQTRLKKHNQVLESFDRARLESEKKARQALQKYGIKLLQKI